MKIRVYTVPEDYIQVKMLITIKSFSCSFQVRSLLSIYENSICAMKLTKSCYRVLFIKNSSMDIIYSPFIAHFSVYSSIGLDDRFSFCKEQFDSAIDYKL